MKMVKIALIIALIASAAAVAIAEDVKRTASIKEINGTVEIMAVEGQWSPASVGMLMNQGDSIRTKADSWAVLNVDGIAETATVEVKPNSSMKLAMLVKDEQAVTENTLLDLSLGEILIKAKKLHSEKSKFEVKTPTSIVGVRGTTFSVNVEAVE